MAAHARRPRTAGVVKMRARHAQNHSSEHTSFFSPCTAQHRIVVQIFLNLHESLRLLAAESEQLSARLKRAESGIEIASESASESASKSASESASESDSKSASESAGTEPNNNTQLTSQRVRNYKSTCPD